MAKHTHVIGCPVLENTTQEKEFNVVSSEQFRRQKGMFSLPETNQETETSL